jgi:hypothetical protein
MKHARVAGPHRLDMRASRNAVPTLMTIGRSRV